MGPIEAPVADSLAQLANGLNRDPFAVLGPHPDERGRGTLVRAFQPAARSVDIRIVETGELRPMTRRSPGGIFEVVIDTTPEGGLRDLNYRLRITFPGEHVIEVETHPVLPDEYQFLMKQSTVDHAGFAPLSGGARA
jgi:hypothetical protein